MLFFTDRCFSVYGGGEEEGETWDYEGSTTTAWSGRWSEIDERRHMCF